MKHSNLIDYLASIPRPVLLLFAGAIYGSVVRWRFRWDMLPDGLLIGLLVFQPSLGLAAWIGVLMIVRHVPTFSADVAGLLRLDSFDGWTVHAVLFALPALRSYMSVMSRSGDVSGEKGDSPVHVPIPSTAGSADTKARSYDDDESRRDQFLITMADQIDERGGYLFSANQIHAAIGGHRATVMARVKERRAAALPPLYRQEDGNTAPAEYPVTGRR